MTTRVLLVSRISDDRDTSGSIQAQQDKHDEVFALRRARGEQLVVVHNVQDRTVSGDVDLSERPALGKWLNAEGRDQWDELWVTTQDRLSRNDIHSMAFIFKVIEWNKVLVIHDDPTLDLHSPEGRLIAHAKAMPAAKELQKIKERTTIGHARRKFTNAWHGGIPPFGYTTGYQFDQDTGKKWRVLVKNPHQSSVLHEVHTWLVHEGESLTGIARRLNDRNELTVDDAWRVAKGVKFVKGQAWQPSESWSVSGLRRTLSKPVLMGIKCSGNQALYNKDGSPVIATDDPVFNETEFRQLQDVLAKRRSVQDRTKGVSPLLGIAFCSRCQKPAYRVKASRATVDYQYYRCSARACPGISIRADKAERLVYEHFLRVRGDQHVIKREFRPGSDNQKELDDLQAKLTRLDNAYENGAYDDDVSYYFDRRKDYAAQRKALESQPRHEAQWVYIEQPDTYRDAFESRDSEGKRRMLLDAGAKLLVGKRTCSLRLQPANTPMGGQPDRPWYGYYHLPGGIPPIDVFRNLIAD